MVTLRLERVTARYGRKVILREITTPVFEGGEVVALLGPNASGKSTLFRRLFGLIKGEGEVRIAGAKTPKPIGYMPQDTGANAVLSVYESVLLARMQGRRLRVAPEDLAKVDETLAYLGISTLGERSIGDLSGGQRQLVGAAQAIVQEPEILLLDEPTAALDLHRQIELLTILRRLARERGVLVMAALHDLGHALRFADQAVVLADGAMIACGKTADVVTPALLREVYRVDARVERCSRGTPQVIVEAALSDAGRRFTTDASRRTLLGAQPGPEAALAVRFGPDPVAAHPEAPSAPGLRRESAFARRRTLDEQGDV